MKKILLDTNAYVRFLRGDEKVMGCLARADTVYMSVFVLGELFAGFKAGSKEKGNKQLLERFLLKPTVSVLDATTDTADIFGFIMASLRKSGTPIPINDVWIAAQCLETGSLLVTYDNHFAQIPGLRLWDEAGH
ncbi:MAG: PilT protein domain protein [Candidatus Aminicenantes bacterium]|nr:PilT protein domain protein [Candidatus Aminicenantes bacterium]